MFTFVELYGFVWSAFSLIPGNTVEVQIKGSVNIKLFAKTEEKHRHHL
jgi:hypothetical protein